MLEIIATGVLVAVATGVVVVSGYMVVRLYRGESTGDGES
jgi:hypothetical protein